MDLRMPGRVDGFVAIRQLRGSPDTASIPIIVISAWGSAKHKAQALEAGADAHLTKPVAIDELVATINCHLTLALSPHTCIVPTHLELRASRYKND
jgi:DNA-binding response OmpR family regulator